MHKNKNTGRFLAKNGENPYDYPRAPRNSEVGGRLLDDDDGTAADAGEATDNTFNLNC